VTRRRQPRSALGNYDNARPQGRARAGRAAAAQHVRISVRDEDRRGSGTGFVTWLRPSPSRTGKQMSACRRISVPHWRHCIRDLTEEDFTQNSRNSAEKSRGFALCGLCAFCSFERDPLYTQISWPWRDRRNSPDGYRAQGSAVVAARRHDINTSAVHTIVAPVAGRAGARGSRKRKRDRPRHPIASRLPMTRVQHPDRRHDQVAEHQQHPAIDTDDGDDKPNDA